MKRVVVLGGLGMFGRTAMRRLHQLGISALSASRHGSADLQIDANDPESIGKTLRAGDLVLDVAGPFSTRSDALLEGAIARGFDLIDLNDDLSYAQRVLAHRAAIERAGIIVMSSSSTVSAISAAAVRHSGVPDPVRISVFLVPAARHTANAGSALSLINSVGRPVRVFRNGRLETLAGWSESRTFSMPAPLGRVRARLFESADSIYLPLIWPSLREVAMYVDTNTPGVNSLLRLAARSGWLRRWLQGQIHLATSVSRMLGSSRGGLGYEIEGGHGQTERLVLSSSKDSFVAALAPALLAARRVAQGRCRQTGLVLADRHTEAGELEPFLSSLGMRFARLPSDLPA